MYIRRKVFSVGYDAYGDERLFSTTEIIDELDYLEQRQFTQLVAGDLKFEYSLRDLKLKKEAIAKILGLGENAKIAEIQRAMASADKKTIKKIAGTLGVDAVKYEGPVTRNNYVGTSNSQDGSRKSTAKYDAAWKKELDEQARTAATREGAFYTPQEYKNYEEYLAHRNAQESNFRHALSTAEGNEIVNRAEAAALKREKDAARKGLKGSLKTVKNWAKNNKKTAIAAAAVPVVTGGGYLGYRAYKNRK